MRMPSFVARALLIATLTVPAGFVSAATITSNTGFALDWNTPATWQGGTIPGPGDSVVIQPGSGVVVASAASVTVNAVTVQGGTSVSPSQSGTLAVDGTLNVTTTTTVVGGTPVAGSGGTAALTVTGTLNTAALNVTGGAGNVTGPGGAASVNLTGSGSTVNVGGNLVLLADHSSFTAGTPTINWSANGGTVHIDGHLTVTYGNLNLDAGTLRLAGNFVGEGETISGGTGTVILDGTEHQHWSGAALALHNLVVTNASVDLNFENAAVTIDTTLDVAGTLTLSGGIVSTGGYFINVNAPGGLVRNSGYINGVLGRNVTGATPYLFPVGTFDLYLPATVTPSTTGFMTVEAFNDVVWGAGANTLAANWAMQGDATLTTLDAVTFGYAGATVNGTEANYVIARQDYAASPVTWQRYPTTLNTAADTASMAVPGTPIEGYWTLGEPSAVTHATQLAVYTVNNGVQPRQNTPFDLVFQAQDGQGNPATFAEYVSLKLDLGTTPAPAGTLTDVDGNVAPLSVGAAAGAGFVTIPNLVYTATGSVSLLLSDDNFVPIFTQVTVPVTFAGPAAQLEVFNSADDGPGTLRHAIITANLGGCSATPCPINFNLPPAEQLGDGTWTILVPASNANMTVGPRRVTANRISGSPLPAIDVPVVLDGTTQPGFNPADPHPVVGIDGDSSWDILTVNGQGSTIRGLAFANTPSVALALQGTGSHVVEGCHVGITAGGAWNDDTAYGIAIRSDNNLVGGNTAAQRNVISGNWVRGIEIENGADANQIRGNYIGTDRGAANAVPNGTGVTITFASGNTIANNVVAGNDGAGVLIDGGNGNAANLVIGDVTANALFAATGNHLEGNSLGYDAGGAELLNGTWDVEVNGSNAIDNVIGGPTAGQGNLIAGGIHLDGGSVGTAILGNTHETANGTPIILNGFAGNDTGDGDVNVTTCLVPPCVYANNGQNTPVIASASLAGSNLAVELSVDSALVGNTQSIRVEVFADDGDGVLELIGNGCYDTNFVNAVTINVPNAPVAAGDLVYATATSFEMPSCVVNDQNGGHRISDGTSQFSAAATVTACSATTPTIAASGPLSFCAGGSVTLTSTLGASYVWKKNGVATGQTGQQFAVSNAGSYTVVVTDGNGCSAESAATTVNVFTNPSAPSITADSATTFCTGGSVVLRTATGWSGYQWLRDNAPIGGATSDAFTATLAGNYTVTITNANGCNATSAATTVTVTAAPAAPTVTASGPTTFCTGGSVVLSSSTGNAYQWRLNGSPIGGATAQTYTATATGNYSVTIDNGGGCTATSAPTSVTVNATPAAPTVSASGPTTFCTGGSVVLTSSTGNAYQWRLNGAPIGGATAQTYTATTTGNYSVTIDNGGAGCTATSAPTAVTVTSTPTPTITANGATAFCQGGNVTLTASATTGSYQWLKNNSPIGGATAQSYTATVAGDYAVIVTENGCPATSAPVTVTTTAFTPSIAAEPFCGGTKLTASAGTSFQWYLDQQPIGGATARTHNATQPGTYKVYVESNGCANFSAPFTYAGPPPQVPPQVSANGPTTFCDGGSVTLSATGGQSYQWLRNGVPITGATSATYVATITGNYTATAVANHCTTQAPQTISVTVTPIPTTAVDAPGTVQPNSTGHVASVIDPVPAATYVWSIAGGTFDSGNSGASVGFTAGSGPHVTLTLTATIGNCTATTTHVVAVGALGADLAVTKSAPAAVQGGATIDYTLAVTNDGPAAASNLYLTDTLPAGTTFVSVNSAWNCAFVAGSVICRAGSLTSGATETVHIVTTAPAQSGTVTNTVTIESATSDPNLANNSASATTAVTAGTACTANGTAQLTAPAANATVASPVTFSWTAVPNATGYRILVAVDGGALQDIASTTGATSVTAAVPAGGIVAFVETLFTGCPATRSSGVAFRVPTPEPCAARAIATPTSPANGATVNSSSIDFRWSAAAGAAEYRLWASIDNGTPAVIGTTTATELRVTIARGDVTWWVESLYPGCASTESPRLRFTIPAAQNCGTARPEALSPNGSTVTNGTVNFVWSSVAGAVGYELWLAHNGGTPTLVATTTATSFTTDVPAGQLSWFVRVLVDRCPPRDSQGAAFTYALPAACDANVRPIADGPVDRALVVSPVTFTWGATETASKFEVYVVRGGQTSLVATTNGRTFSADDVALANGAATWFVRAHFAAGCPPLDSAEQQLVVVPQPAACAVPAAPVISAPGQVSSDSEFKIQWTPIPAATSYELQVASSADFANAEVIATEAAERELVRRHSGADAITVFARVRAINGRCASPALSAYSTVIAVHILPVLAPNGGTPAVNRASLLSTLPLGPELAGQTFAAVSPHPFISISPASGIVPAGGINLSVAVDTTALPLGTTVGSITITLSTPGSSRVGTEGVTSVTTPVSVNLVTPITPTPKNTPPPDALIIPAVAHANGINSQFQSDIRVSNTSPQLMKYQLTFTPSGEAGIGSGRQTTFAIEPGRTIALDDVLKSWFGTGNDSVTGTLEVRPLTQTATSTSSAAVGALANLVTFASSRTFNITPNGTFGQFIPAVPFANFIDTTKALSLQQIAHSAKYRTNLGLVEGSGEPAQLLVKVFGSTGMQLTQFPVALNGGQHLQLNGFLAQHGITALDDGRVEVSVTGGNGKVTAYASVLDNDTSDPLLVTPVTLGANGNTRWVVPGVADLSNGLANWQSDVRLFNAGTTATNVTLSFYSQNGGAAKTMDITLQPGEVRQLDRALNNLFGVTQDGGAMHIETATAARLIATARTYNQTSTGTYGQFISAVTPEESVAVGSRPLQLLQVEESTRYRSNIGLAEVTGKAVTLEVSVVPPDSKFTATTQVTLAPNEFRQITSLLANLGLGETYNARVTVKAVAGEGRATAYASVIDLKTQDPTYVPAQ